jgi:protein-disulfide isomerase
MRQPAFSLPLPLPRRHLLAAALATPFAAQAAVTEAFTAERGIGKADAPVTVFEYFSLTCSHCAAFSKEVFPQIRKELIDTGVIRMVWRDFPLDRLALTAAAVARTLPAEKYEAFVTALLGSQDRWAFTKGNQMDALAGVAALAGMPRSTFDAVVADEALQRGIMEQRAIAEKEAEVRATPSFTFKGKGGTKNVSGGMAFAEFKKLVDGVNKA